MLVAPMRPDGSYIDRSFPLRPWRWPPFKLAADYFRSLERFILAHQSRSRTSRIVGTSVPSVPWSRSTVLTMRRVSILTFRVFLPILGLLMAAFFTEAFKPCGDARARCCRGGVMRVTGWTGVEKEVSTICEQLQGLCSFHLTSPRYNARGPSIIGLPRAELTASGLTETPEPKLPLTCPDGYTFHCCQRSARISYPVVCIFATEARWSIWSFSI